MKRLILHTRNTEASFGELTMFGLCSTEKLYRVVYFASKSLETHFQHFENVLLNNLVIPDFYKQHNPADDSYLFLLANKMDTGFVLPKYKKADFLFAIATEDPEKIKMIKDKLLNEKVFHAIFPIQSTSITFKKLIDFDKPSI